ncbi:MAG: HNH endonuclease signature motif containing protein [Elusimicrobia bacterium]|nr:HNH endonuclease signature motif containing protein [Elusimicrobiota bacterium]
MKKKLGKFLAAIGFFAVLAGGLSAGAAPQAKSAGLGSSAVLSKLDLTGGGVFAAVPSAFDIQAPASVPGAPVPTVAAPAAADNGRQAPDWSFTPGRLCTASDSDFKEYRYAEHIPYCNRNVTQQMKQEVAAHYGVPQSDWPKYEFDHLIPLCIGGNSHVENLWPQPRGQNGGSDEKDKLELDLYKQMVAGTITQAEAVRQTYAWFGVAPQMRSMPSTAVAAVSR